MAKTDKERYWTFICYPESLPKNWKEILQETGLQCAISPLHDKDINADDTQKKKHYHVLLVFNGPTTYNRVESITKELNATIPKRVMSVVGMIRYFTHKDNPEKAQYNEEDITTINGLDIKELNGITTTEIERIKRNVITIVNENKIREYATLIDYLQENEMYDYLEVVSNKTIFFKAYLDSKRWSINKKDLKWIIESANI